MKWVWGVVTWLLGHIVVWGGGNMVTGSNRGFGVTWLVMLCMTLFLFHSFALSLTGMYVCAIHIHTYVNQGPRGAGAPLAALLGPSPAAAAAGHHRVAAQLSPVLDGEADRDGGGGLHAAA